MSFPFPLLWLVLVAMWLALNDSLAPADVIIGALVAYVAVRGLAVLEPPGNRLLRPWTAVSLIVVVFADIVRSNVAVAKIVLAGSIPRTDGFVDIPLDTRHPMALAGLACIVTATPGTSWAGFDSQSGVLTLHVLDNVDEAALVLTIKERYERRLMEIFE